MTNVVTELQGTPIPPSTLKGVMLEGAGTNIFLENTNYSTATSGSGVISATNIGDNIIDVDYSTEGTYALVYVVLDMSGSVGDSFTISNQCYMKTISGKASDATLGIGQNGSPYLTDLNPISDSGYIDNGEWQQVKSTNTIITSTSTSLRIVMLSFHSTCNVQIKFRQAELSPFATSYIKTTSASAARNADIRSYPSTGIIDDTKGSFYCEISTEWTDAIDEEILILGDGTNKILYINTSRELCMFDGTNTHTGNVITGTDNIKIGCNWGDSLMNTFINGVAGTASTFDDNFSLGATLYFGSNLFGGMKDDKIWKRKQSNNQLAFATK